MNDDGISMEELQQALTDAQKNADDLGAERDSLKEELQQIREELTQTKKELQDAKKLNYTLGRRLDISAKQETPEEILAAIYKEGSKHDN